MHTPEEALVKLNVKLRKLGRKAEDTFQMAWCSLSAAYDYRECYCHIEKPCLLCFFWPTLKHLIITGKV